eukprot:08973.XXX_59061_59234_1 [CDS] Oithona nana genome sequencing.
MLNKVKPRGKMKRQTSSMRTARRWLAKHRCLLTPATGLFRSWVKLSSSMCSMGTWTS